MKTPLPFRFRLMAVLPAAAASLSPAACRPRRDVPGASAKTLRLAVVRTGLPGITFLSDNQHAGEPEVRRLLLPDLSILDR